MDIKVDEHTMFVFDLDDTLYKEIDFLKSAYLNISRIIEEEIGKNIYNEMVDYYFQKKVVFDEIKSKYNLSLSMQDLISMYRFHMPIITLSEGAAECLSLLKAKRSKIGLITDGRSLTQRNKLQALSIEHYFDIIVISEEIGSEKPNEINYKLIEERFPQCAKFIYLADNFTKDFLVPNRRNWISIGLVDNGENIHSQNINLNDDFLPKYYISSLKDLNLA